MKQVDIGRVIAIIPLKNCRSRILSEMVGRVENVSKAHDFRMMVVCRNNRNSEEELMRLILSEGYIKVSDKYFGLDELDLKNVKLFHYPYYLEV